MLSYLCDKKWSGSVCLECIGAIRAVDAGNDDLMKGSVVVSVREEPIIGLRPVSR